MGQLFEKKNVILKKTAVFLQKKNKLMLTFVGTSLGRRFWLGGGLRL
jgi:hypothetical protein